MDLNLRTKCEFLNSFVCKLKGCFMKSFISLLLLHTIFFLLIVLYFPHIPFRLVSTALLLAISHVLLDLGVPCVEVMCCVTTQVHAHMMPASVLDYWLPAENSFSLDCTVVRRAWSLRLTKMVPWRINSQEDTDRQTMALPVFRVLFTETKLEEERSPCTVDWSRDQVRQMTKSRSVAGGWQGSLPRPKYHPNAPP